jgi:hypothetical protein
MGVTREINPKEVDIIIGGNNHKVVGFQSGAYLDIAYDVDNFNDDVGPDGEGARIATNNFAADITITLKQTSLSNDILSVLNNVDRVAGKAAFPLTIKDNWGNTLNFSAQTWVKKMANQPQADSVQPRVWVLRTLHLNGFVGGNRSAS